MEVYKSTRVYIGKIYIGFKGYPEYALLSTSNNFNRFLCHPCRPCFNHQNPDVFVPGDSKSIQNISCINERYCHSLPKSYCDVNNNCNYNFTNGDKYIRGTLYKDRLRLFRKNAGIASFNFIFGCIHGANEHINPRASGFIALSMHEHSLVRQLGVKVFSYCLPSRENERGMIYFGPAVQLPGPGAIIAPLVNFESNLYYVKILAFQVQGGDPIIINEDHVEFLVETGDPMSFVDPDTMRRLIDSIKAVVTYPALKSMDPSLASNDEYDLCFEVKDDPDDPRLPWMMVVFEGGAIFLDKRNIFLRHRGNNWCFTFKSNSIIGGGKSILGSQTYLKREIVVYLTEQKNSFSEFGKC